MVGTIGQEIKRHPGEAYPTGVPIKLMRTTIIFFSKQKALLVWELYLGGGGGVALRSTPNSHSLSLIVPQ